VTATEAQITESLLKHGGSKVIFQPEKFWLEEIVRGKLFDPVAIKWLKGQKHRCHLNVVGGYLLRFGDLRIATGFALAKEAGLWLRHSWLSGLGVIYETTHKFDLYWGIVLDHRTELNLHFIFEEVMPITAQVKEDSHDQAD